MVSPEAGRVEPEKPPFGPGETRVRFPPPPLVVDLYPQSGRIGCQPLHLETTTFRGS